MAGMAAQPQAVAVGNWGRWRQVGVRFLLVVERLLLLLLAGRGEVRHGAHFHN
jgi:hypothetical protein